MAKMNQIKPRIVAIVGAKGAGKDELAEYLVRKHRVLAVELGTFARQLAKAGDEGEPHLRYDVSAKSLSEYGSEHILQQLVAEILESDQHSPQALVITGVRSPAEAAVLKANFGSDLLLVYVKVGDQEMRYDRVHKRNFTTDPNDLQDFVQQDEQLKSDYGLVETAELADLTLWNKDSRQAYYQQIETHIVPHLFRGTLPGR